MILKKVFLEAFSFAKVINQILRRLLEKLDIVLASKKEVRKDIV